MIEGVRDDLTKIKVAVGVLEDRLNTIRARNQAIPGWLLAAAAIVIPLLAGLATTWLGRMLP